MVRREIVAARVRGLVDQFERYVEAYDRSVGFSSDQLASHRTALALRRRAGSVSSAIADAEFVSSLRRTLIAWRLNARGSRLVPEPDFTNALAGATPAIEALERFQIDAEDLPPEVPDRLWKVIYTLGIVDNDAKLVAATKTLHHLLPDLVPPMDREWTGRFFRLHAPEWQGASQRGTFLKLYRTFVDVARQAAPQRFVTEHGWRTSRTKILDNALIGYCKTELAQPNGSNAGSVISFHVPGYPPTKNEALSLLSDRHPHAPRVRALLTAARDALSNSPEFAPILDGPVGLDLAIHASPEMDTWDATNYLGGVADVLEDKAHRGAAVAHLGDLVHVCMYHNDRQIKSVSYEETPGQPGYVVTVRALEA